MLEDNPLWYKDAVIYEVHVRAFQDSDGDGIGDFRGLRQRLDYLQDLGITAIWLLPFYPSPLKDDGYDIADYTDVHPSYGNVRDFQDFLNAAHDKGLRVITELVINHTSEQHAWFQRARRAPRGSVERDFYVWSDDPNKFAEARIIFKDFERSNWTWDPVAQQYYWHRFYSHQPDLNYDNPAVWESLIPILDFWMAMGVDGMRLDAIPYLYEREGTNCENLPETHAFLKHLRKHMDEKFPGRMFLAEANQWPEDAIAYFGDGDECNMAFHFPVMPRLFMSVHMEDRFPIIDILDQTPPIPENCQWCMFLRNHDELTLEMVTDEERDYMYRAYAEDPQARINLGIRHRLAPLLKRDRRRVELMNAMLFSLPGTPVLYYGDEIGMGDNIYLGDRNGVRTPMQWSGDRNAGFSRANPQRLFLPIIIDPEYHYEAVNVEAHQGNTTSLLWWTKRLIALRKQYKAFGRGTLEFLKPSNSKILAFIRRYEDECLLVVANLSRFVQYVELDMSEFKGSVPYELFGRTPFPPIGDLTYLLTLGPHAFYWFALSPVVPGHRRGGDFGSDAFVPAITVRERWQELFETEGRDGLEALLLGYAVTGDGTGDHAVKNVVVREAAPIPRSDPPIHLVLYEAEFANGTTELRALPVGLMPGDGSEGPSGGIRPIGKVRRRGEPQGMLVDARTDPHFGSAVLAAIAGRQLYPMGSGEVAASEFPRFAEVAGAHALPAPSSFVRGEQSNVSIVFGDQFILKLYQKVEDGVNPDLEVGRFLSERTDFSGIVPVLGALEYRLRRGEPKTLAVLSRFATNEGDAWQYTLNALSRFYEAALAVPEGPPAMLQPVTTFALADPLPAEPGRGLIESYLPTVDRIGRQTAELHAALASHPDEPAFAPEAFGRLYQRSIYQSMRNLTGRVLRDLSNRLPSMAGPVRELGQQVLNLEHAILERFRSVLERKINGMRIRTHNDYHLGHLLYTGSDFVVFDFEGTAQRSLTERRIKRSPLRDVASMVRSFHYAAFSPLFGAESDRGTLPGHIREEDRPVLERWAHFWFSWVSSRYVTAYHDSIRDKGLLPDTLEACSALLHVFEMEKALGELNHELKHRLHWVPLPLRGILELMGVR